MANWRESAERSLVNRNYYKTGNAASATKKETTKNRDTSSGSVSGSAKPASDDGTKAAVDYMKAVISGNDPNKKTGIEAIEDVKALLNGTASDRKTGAEGIEYIKSLTDKQREYNADKNSAEKKNEDDENFLDALLINAKQALKSVGQGITNMFVNSINNQLEMTKYDPAMIIAEDHGWIEGYSKNYGKVIDKQIEESNKNMAKRYEKQQEEFAKEKESYSNLPAWQQTAAELVGSSAQLIPQVAVSALDPTLGMGLLASQVYGNSYAEALAGGATKEEAMGYGALSAGTELAIEKVVGGIPFMKGVMDKHIAKGAAKLVSSPSVRKIAKYAINAGGEGIEEVASEFLAPFLKRYTYDENAQAPTSADYLMAFAGGFTGSAIFGGVGLTIDLSPSLKKDLEQKRFYDNKANNLYDKYFESYSKDMSKGTGTLFTKSENTLKIKKELDDTIKKINIIDKRINERIKGENVLSKLKKKPTVSVGEKYYDTKTKQTFSIVSRDNSATTILVTNPDGTRIVKPFSNESADMLKTSKRYVVAESAESTPINEDTVTETDATTVPEAAAVSVSVGDTFKDAKTGNTLTVVGLDKDNTYFKVVHNGKVTDKRKAVPNSYVSRNFFKDGGYYKQYLYEGKSAPTNAVERTIPNTMPISKNAEFENESTKKVNSALKSEEIGIKVPFNAKEGLVKYVASHIGDKVRVTMSDGTTDVRTIKSMTKNGVNTMGSDGNVRTVFFANIAFTDTGFTFTNSDGSMGTVEFIGTRPETNTNERSVEDVEVIEAVANAMIDTLKPDALDKLSRAYEKAGEEFSVDIFVRDLIDAYRNSGNLGVYAQFFEDGGKKVVEAIEETLDAKKSSEAERVEEVSKKSDVTIMKEGGSYSSLDSDTILVSEGFEDGISESDVDIKFSIESIPGTDKKYVQANEQVIKSENPDDWETEIFDYVNKVVRNGEDFVIPMDNEENIVITERTAWKLSDRGSFADDYYMVKGNASGVIDEIIAVSKYLRSKPPMKLHSDGFARYGFDYRKAYFMDLDGKYYELQLSVGINAEGREAYNIGQIKQVAVPSKRLKGPKGTTTSNGNITYEKNIVNTHSMQNTDKYSFESEENVNAEVDETRSQSENDEIRMSVSDDVGEQAKENKGFLDKLRKSVPFLVNTQNIFDVSKDSIVKSGKITDAITSYFKSIGGKVVNPTLGVVELSKRGAKTTVFHGMSGDKFTAVAAIKDVIEKGSIIAHSENWKSRGYDTYLLAGKGSINGNEAIVGVIIKNYPNSKENNKFYLHEIIKIGVPHTAVENNTIRVNEQTPINDNILSQDNNIVNNNDMQNTDKYSFESEENANGRNDILYDNSGRRGNEGADEQAGTVQKAQFGNRGKAESERKTVARKLFAENKTQKEIITADSDGKKVRVRFNVIDPSAYDADMQEIVDAYRAIGIDAKLFVGSGEVAFATGENFTVDGLEVGGKEIYLRYDGKHAPQVLRLHEVVHINWNSGDVQKAKNDILDSLTEEEKKSILASERYRKYARLYGKNTDAIMQEFVADVLAGMSEYSARFSDIVQTYWNNNSEFIDSYKVSEYTESIDTGGVDDGSENTQTLGKGRAGENNDSVWQRSDDSEKIYNSLGSTQKSLRRGKNSGYRYIDWSRVFGDIDVYEQTEKEYAYGVLREISRLDISNADQNGRKLSKEQKQYFKATVAKNSKGDLIPLYHATDGDFTVFELGDFAYHVGDLAQAMDMGKEFIKEVYIDLKNPLFIEYDAGIWSGAEIAEALKEQNIITQVEYNNLAKLDGFDGNDSNSEANRAIKALMKEKKYDGIVYRNDHETRGLSFMLFDSNQIKYTSNQNPTNDKDIRFSFTEGTETDVDTQWDEKIEKYGTIPKGENPTRDIDVPKKINDKKVVSRFARTMLEAGVTPDDAVSEFEKRILDGEMTHEVITNKKALNNARKTIEYDGFEDALNDWYALARRGKVDKNSLVLGMELYNQCITNKDTFNAMKIAADLAAEATRAGQTLQACRMLKLMSPDGQLYYLEQSVRKMNDEFRKRLGEKYKDIELDDDLLNDFLTEKNKDARDFIWDNICQNVANQIPATFKDKWDAWRYLAMLGNPRTHIRNIVGNAVFYPAERISGYVEAVLQKGFVKKENRTKTLKKDKAAVEFAKKDFEKMQKTIQGSGGKYAMVGDIEERRTIFKTKILELIRYKNFEFLEKEDLWFLRRHYVDALAKVITARGWDVNNLDAKSLDIARAIAIKEAQTATYRDANAIAEALSKIERKARNSDSKVIQAGGILLEGTMPFKKTPMNIAKQGVYYSPAGLLLGSYKGLANLKNGDAYSANDVIKSFSKGLTGTGVMLLGMFLSSLGVLVGGDDEDAKKSKFDKLVGEQSYALKIGEHSYTIDWMIPSSLPLFIGNELYGLTKDDFKFADIVNAASSLTEPLLELSVFSGINDVIETTKYSNMSAVEAVMNNMASSYVMQALPTLGGQFSRIIDPQKREYYYADKTSSIPVILQRFIGQASSKIPGVSYLFTPSIDEWGREKTYGEAAERILENTVSPGYYSQENYTEVDKELKRLYDLTGDNAVLPVTQQKYFKEDGVVYYMSAKDYAEVMQIRGKKSFELINELMLGKERIKLQDKDTGKYFKKSYAQMSDEEKVRAIEKCYKEAGEYAKKEMLEKIKGASNK